MMEKNEVTKLLSLDPSDTGSGFIKDKESDVITHPTDDELERVAKDCALAAKVLREAGTYETGQSIIDEAAALLRACKCGAVKVKPLEWPESPRHTGVYKTKPVLGLTYRMHIHAPNRVSLSVSGVYGSEDYGSEYEAKAAAQADCERRILSVLLFTPDARQEAWRAGVEAAAKVVCARWVAYQAEHGIFDHTTGVTEYPGNGEEWMEEWEELEGAIRDLAEKGPDHEPL